MLKKVNIPAGEQVRLFSSICIETSSRCNRHCYFCPNAYHDRVDEYMPIPLINKMLSELRQLKYRGRVSWYIYNEPTRDRRLADIIQHAKFVLPQANQMINTNGDYFKSAEDIKHLFDCGLSQMQINVYSSADDSARDDIFQKGIRLAELRYEKLKAWCDTLLEHDIHQDLNVYQHIGSKKAVRVVKKFGIRRDAATLDGQNHFTNRSGNIPAFRESVTEPLQKHCIRPFRVLNINWNGNAILCCNDYYGTTNFGNAATASLQEIWNHPAFNLYRLKLQNKMRDCHLCHNCDFFGGYYPHMLDNVTFGEERDNEILKTDYTDARKIFDSHTELQTH